MLIILFVIPLSACGELPWPRVFEGTVYDCTTSQPLAGAQIELWQQSLLTWDKIHKFNGVTNEQGKFSIAYNIGSTIHARTSADGYLLSDEWAERGPVRIGLLRRRPEDALSEYSIQCKRSAECSKELNDNGVHALYAICGSLEAIPQSK